MLKQKVEEYFPEAVKLRRHLHRYPEPCFQEEKTAAFITQYLKECGIEAQTGLAGYGIKAVIHGQKTSPVVGIRTDMDALTITENTGLDFASQNPGMMHACGHDAHMTNALIAARVLNDMREQIPGTIVMIFQPCEEGAPDGSLSGADRMIEAGVLENPHIDAMVGLHVMPGYHVGTVALRPGPLMANVASVFITIHGKSSHGAFPHQGIDAIYAASMAVIQFQSLISRSKDPNERGVLSIGRISGGSRYNVIADRVDMEGTVRTFSFETQNMIEKGMENILKGLETSLGIHYDFRFEKVAKFVKNDEKLSQWAIPYFKKVLGDNQVLLIDPVTIGEDFSAYSHQIPALFFFLGVGMEGSLHSPTFSVDEESLKYGPLLLCGTALEFLKHL